MFCGLVLLINFSNNSVSEAGNVSMHCFEGCFKSLVENTVTFEKRMKWTLENKLKIILAYDLDACICY